LSDLFSVLDQSDNKNQPLAERVRPRLFEDFSGQSEAFGQGSLLTNLLITDKLPSLVLWGPPGSGKTSFAHLVSKNTKSTFINRSAIDTGAKDLKLEGEQAKQRLLYQNLKTILFIDEIHRLNKSQQDCLLPYIEKGYLSLIGATTENPSFELNSALLSRCQVIVFHAHDETSLSKILNRALKTLDEKISWLDISNDSNVLEKLISDSGGDARRALNLLENIFAYFSTKDRKSLSAEQIREAIQYIPPRYDKSGEMHYDIISAFIKSIRGSDPDAALYYMVRMLKGGESPLFIARRLVILASEDIGNADPRALLVAMNVKEAVDFVGLPEASINLAQAVTYLASAPKSNASYMGLRNAEALVKEFPNEEVPLDLRNSPTKLMDQLGYGDGYKYAHDEKSGVSNQRFMPSKLENKKLYKPTTRGYEKNIASYLEWVETQRKNS
jgi:putative ATPase